MREARLLDPGPTHSSAPTVLAISPTSHLLLTASESPPTVYLQNLTLATQPLFLQPHASVSPVTCAAFHPERRNIFLLAFKDGTLAAYDANQVMRPSGCSTGNSRAEGQEIAFFKSLHNVATHATRNPAGGLYMDAVEDSGLISAGITGAAFVPGYRSRAVTVGADGKCKIVDFEKGQIVRTWHVRGPATSLTILSPGQVRKASKNGVPRKPTSMASAVRTVFAIGRIDGKVVLFDNSGAKLRDLPVDDYSGRVVDVEWVKGPGPRVLGESAEVQFTSETWIELFAVGGTLRSRKSEMSGESSRTSQGPQESHEENIALHRATETDGSTTASPGESHELLSGPLDSVEIEQPEMDLFSTVKHNQMEGPVQRDLPPISSNDYMDLFSPVKKAARQPTPPRPSPPKRRTTPRSRPRLSSSTFVYQGSSPPQPNYVTKASSKPAPENSPAGLSKAAGQSLPPKKRRVVSKSVHDAYTSPLLRGIKVPASNLHSTTATTPASTSSTSSANSKILADLRRLGEKGAFGSSKDNRAILAPYMPVQSRKVSSRRSSLGGRSAAKSKVLPSSSSPAPVVPEKKNLLLNGEDIWLTAESDNDEDLPKSSPDMMPQPTTSGHQRQVSWEAKANTIWDDVEEDDTVRRPRRELNPKQVVEIKLAPPRTKTKSRITGPIEQIEKTDFGKRFSAPSPPLTNPGEESSPLHIRHQPTQRRNSRSAPTAREVEQAKDAEIGTVGSPRGRLDSAATLPPGFAHSFHGPVSVHKYVPRKASLAFIPASSPATSPVKSGAKGKNVLGEISGNERRSEGLHGRMGSYGAATVDCEGCEELKDEVERLRQEVVLLRRLLKGRDMKVV